jgi:hypothetical protein
MLRPWEAARAARTPAIARLAKGGEGLAPRRSARHSAPLDQEI